MDTSPWDLVQRELNSAILLKLLADREKGMWISSGRGTKRRVIFLYFLETP